MNSYGWIECYEWIVIIECYEWIVIMSVMNE